MAPSKTHGHFVFTSGLYRRSPGPFEVLRVAGNPRPAELCWLRHLPPGAHPQAGPALIYISRVWPGVRSLIGFIFI